VLQEIDPIVIKKILPNYHKIIKNYHKLIKKIKREDKSQEVDLIQGKKVKDKINQNLDLEKIRNQIKIENKTIDQKEVLYYLFLISTIKMFKNV
jgi:hypothetical protein